MLGVFTAIGAVTAHAFWKRSGRARVEALTVFLMHLGLIAAFVLCALVGECHQWPLTHSQDDDPITGWIGRLAQLGDLRGGDWRRPIAPAIAD